jgi:hypothetical protein
MYEYLDNLSLISDLDQVATLLYDSRGFDDRGKTAQEVFDDRDPHYLFLDGKGEQVCVDLKSGNRPTLEELAQRDVVILSQGVAGFAANNVHTLTGSPLSVEGYLRERHPALLEYCESIF